MSKQLMIYDNIQPLSEKHAKWSISVEDHAFVSHLNSVPLLASEISSAAAEFPIIFSKTGVEGEYLPLAVMGLKDDQNLLLNDKNILITRYVPAFIRRYPFILGGAEGAEMMTLCLDEDSKAVVKDGSRGERLFNDDGSNSDLLNDIIAFQQDYQSHAPLTRNFSKKLHELGLLEPMSANISFKAKEEVKLNLGGFFVVKRENLKAISDEEALDLFKKDGLELIYAHMNSLSNFNRLIDIMSAQLAKE
ncbi:peptidase [Cellvibrio zantedeschiae]|uniref:Peptidase n=1 Tax=Cellvibrio zantedeschiae TaxID=1237077 RepID=A0ABQ3B4B2_9GAMM|nr:SapC family protein [Cellvibrio zantedeschiae]GGY73321.1 peptidase [Cellvibrio zantedeschiae]